MTNKHKQKQTEEEPDQIIKAVYQRNNIPFGETEPEPEIEITYERRKKIWKKPIYRKSRQVLVKKKK